MRYLIAFILRWKVVWLRDFDGEVVQRLARPTPFGMKAHRYWVTPVMLLPEGKILMVRGSKWCVEWKLAP